MQLSGVAQCGSNPVIPWTVFLPTVKTPKQEQPALHMILASHTVREKQPTITAPPASLSSELCGRSSAAKQPPCSQANSSCILWRGSAHRMQAVEAGIQPQELGVFSQELSMKASSGRLRLGPCMHAVLFSDLQSARLACTVHTTSHKTLASGHPPAAANGSMMRSFQIVRSAQHIMSESAVTAV
jgi:hypothetical protein